MTVILEIANSDGISLADILAIIAIVISVITAIVTYVKDKRAARKDHELLLFGDLYKDYMVAKFPITRSKLHVSVDGKLTGTEELIECLNGMRKDFLYYKYANNEFFEKIRTDLQHLEDYLIKSEEESLVDEKLKTFENTVEEELLRIYADITEHFSNY